MRMEKPEYWPEDKDLTNERVIIKILESGSDKELEKLREFHALTAEQAELFRAFAKLRKKTHEDGGKCGITSRGLPGSVESRR